MRALFVASLALVLVALPAAQAEACRCGVEGSASSCGCCCAAADRACSCCPTDEEQEPDRLDGDCSCTQSAPQAPAPVMDDVPAVEALASAPDTGGARLVGAHVVATVEHRAPHPTVSLPLLL